MRRRSLMWGWRKCSNNMAKDYRATLRKILEDHPEIESINVEYRKTERLTIGVPVEAVRSVVGSIPDGEYVPTPEPAGYVSPSGLRPIINPQVSPEVIARLRGQTTVETINILNAPPEKS